MALDSLWQIAEIVRTSETIAAASAGFAAWLATHHAELLYHCQVSPLTLTEDNTLYSALPDRIKDLRGNLGPDTTCPLISSAAHCLEDFDAKIQPLESDDKYVQHFVDEIGKAPFESVAVMPVRLENFIHVFFIGLDHVAYDGEVRNWLRVAVFSFCSAVSTRFPIEFVNRNKSGLAEGISLSGKQIQCLQLAAIGKSDAEIAGRLQLSERAVSHCFDISMEKLKASNRTHAVALAVHLNIINGDNTSQKLQYHRRQD